MSEENPQDGNKPQDGSITAEELTRLQASDQELSDLQKEASQMGFTNMQDYLDYLHELAKGGEKPPETVPVTPAVPAPAPVAAAPAPPAPAPVDNSRADEATKIALAAFLETQHMGFILEQGQLDEDKRTSFTKDQLTKSIHGPEGGLIERLAKHPKHAGNLFSAANEYLNSDTIAADARKEGAEAADALANAKETAVVVIGGAPAAPTVLDEVAQNDQDLASAIAPVTNARFAEKK